ncbi:hypothetical protein V2J09_014090 [Rumex salicifolius]
MEKSHQIRVHTLFSFLLIITSAAVYAAAATRALLAIKQSFDNGTHFSSWDSDNDCCRYWNGVKCDSVTHRVNQLSILGVNGIPSTLTGVIPEAVGDLTGLTMLRFHKLQNLTGSIPPSMARLQSLIFADFSWNSLSGPVPTFFRHMRSLRILDLSYNGFSGSLPPELALGPAIASIDLSRNMLTGPIPAGFGSFKTAGINLLLSHNRLTGEIPTSLKKVQFTRIDLSRNDFTGDSSVLFANGGELEDVNLSRNRFSFNMSNVYLSSAAANLISLDISHNRIFGGLPAALGDAPNLQSLNVTYNRLCGQIPAIGGNMSRYGVVFGESSYVHNKCLCGTPLPACH